MLHPGRGTLLFFFFFSSRSRHTSWPRDWSSDVCSSDLLGITCTCPLNDGSLHPPIGDPGEIRQVLVIVLLVREQHGICKCICPGEQRNITVNWSGLLHGCTSRSARVDSIPREELASLSS